MFGMNHSWSLSRDDVITLKPVERLRATGPVASPVPHTVWTLLDRFTNMALTAGEVWRVVGVGQKQVVGLGHPEVNHLSCVLQSPHRILMHHIFKTHVVYLMIHDRRKKENSVQAFVQTPF